MDENKRPADPGSVTLTLTPEQVAEVICQWEEQQRQAGVVVVLAHDAGRPGPTEFKAEDFVE